MSTEYVVLDQGVAMKLNQSQRILYILKKLSTHEKVCTKRMVNELAESERNIQRDMKLLKEFLGEGLVGIERGCYQLLHKHYFSDMLKEHHDTKELVNFLELLSLMDSRSLQFLERQEFDFLKHIKKDASQIYTIFDHPIGELHKSSFIVQLKSAISQRRYCDIIYKEKEPRQLKNIQPQRILYARNNWYLAAMTQNYKLNGGFKLFRINFIEKLTLQRKTFHRDLQAEEHIKSLQSLFHDFRRPDYEVIVRADKEVARYFRVKKYLSSQKILKVEEGDLILSFMINNDMEIIPLIKTWLPHLRVISPSSLDATIRDLIKLY